MGTNGLYAVQNAWIVELLDAIDAFQDARENQLQDEEEEAFEKLLEVRMQ